MWAVRDSNPRPPGCKLSVVFYFTATYKTADSCQTTLLKFRPRYNPEPNCLQILNISSKIHVLLKRDDMASLFKLKHPNGTKSYYGSVYIDGKRYRKKLSDTKHTAIKLLWQYEHELLLKPTFTLNPSISHLLVPKSPF